jgi:hypothetical protein
MSDGIWKLPVAAMILLPVTVMAFTGGLSVPSTQVVSLYSTAYVTPACLVAIVYLLAARK